MDILGLLIFAGFAVGIYFLMKKGKKSGGTGDGTGDGTFPRDRNDDRMEP